MKIYTKKGDEGNTQLLGGTMVKKTHVKLECYGTIDELNAFIERYSKALPFFNLNGSWSIIDPYYGIIFLNKRGQAASIQELKNEDWGLFTFELQSIDVKNFKSIFYNNFDDFKQVKENYMNLFSQIPTQEMINMTNSFELGGRSFTQSPLGRLKFIFRSLLYE